MRERRPLSERRIARRDTAPDRPLTWRDVVATAVLALAMPALVWVLSAPQTALTAAACAVLGGGAVRAARAVGARDSWSRTLLAAATNRLREG